MAGVVGSFRSHIQHINCTKYNNYFGFFSKYVHLNLSAILWRILQ